MAQDSSLFPIPDRILKIQAIARAHFEAQQVSTPFASA
jgi:hypothetical protein